MGAPPGSQVVPLPSNLPFRVVSKTIGSGAYASIRKAIPRNASGPVVAVKFINKDHAFRTGHLKPKQIHLEITHHSTVSPHDNIIRFGNWGEDAAWIWITLELAEGGDLFDKIEADEGVNEDVAHFYFLQLCSAIGWCHGKGVAHRDIKPENMLLDKDGNLKLADFGLATRFYLPRTGESKKCGMVCGSPPYIAPEILAVGNANHKRKNGEDKVGYDPQISDIWSCAIVLFVLLAGNTPWDCPNASESYEYYDYIKSKGRPKDDLWAKIPTEALSLVRGMLKVEPDERFTMQDARKHLWFTKKNHYMDEKTGKTKDSVALATDMLQSLHIDFRVDVPSSQQSQGEAMDVDSNTPTTNSNAISQDSGLWQPQFIATQPETPAAEMSFDWEAPPRPGAGGMGVSASQPLMNNRADASHANYSDLLAQLSEDPSMSQFTPTPSVPLSLTQQAQQFKDIVPSHSLARFITLLTFAQLLPMLLSAFHRLNIRVAEPSQAALEGHESLVRFRVKTLDARKQELQGDVVVERIRMQTLTGGGVLEVRFVKAKGDPLGWRRLFKQMAILCRDAVVVPS